MGGTKCASNSSLECFSPRCARLLLQLFNRMKGEGVKATRATYNAVLHACSAQGELGDAKQVLEDMAKDGVRLNVVTYNIGDVSSKLIINHFNNERQQQQFFLSKQHSAQQHKAWRLFEWWIISTHDAVSSSSSHLNSLRMYRRARARSTPPLPLEALNSRARAGDARGAVDLLAEMDKAGIAPSVVSFATAISAAANFNSSALAATLLTTMEASGLTPNSFVFTAALTACENDPDDSAAAQAALAIVESMARAGARST